MSASLWFGGIVALAAVSSLVIRGLVYLRSKNTESRDMRLELRRHFEQFAHDVGTAEDLLPRVKKSRQRVLAATHQLNSGAMEEWLRGIAMGEAAVSRWMSYVEGFGDAAVTIGKMGFEEMEVTLGDVDKLQLQATALIKELEGCLEQDDRRREEIRRTQQGSLSDLLNREP